MATFLGYSNFSGKNGDKFSGDLLYDIIEQNIVGNYTLIRLYGYIRSWGYSGSGTYCPFYINGINAGGFSSIATNQYSEVARLDVTVQHDDMGKGVLEWSLFVDTGWTLGDASASGSLELPVIPRASEPIATSANIEDAITIYTNRKSTLFTHNITYSFGSLSGNIASDVIDSCIFTLPKELYSQIPDSQSGTGTIYCETYNGTEKIGNTQTCTFNAYANKEKCLPQVSLEVEDTNELAISLTGNNKKLIKFVSNPKVKMSSSAKNYSSILSNIINCGDGQTFNGTETTFNNVESGNFKGIVTDSRNYSNEYEENLDLIQYVKLTLNPTVFRPTQTGSEIQAVITGNYFNGNFGDLDNTLELKFRYKESYTDSWSDYSNIPVTIKENKYEVEVSLGDIYDYQKSYIFEFLVEDKIQSLSSEKTISKGIPILLLCEKMIEMFGSNVFQLQDNETILINGNLKISESNKFLKDL